MDISSRLRTRLGSWFWIASIQYYLVQSIVAARWPAVNRYSWANNTISDLGNTNCGLYIASYVCSPWYLLMNVSFVILGLTMICGAVVYYRHLAANRLSRAGYACMVLAGIGTILVGLFPENTIAPLHIIGAALPFVFGSIGLLLIGFSMDKIHRAMRIFTVVSGLTGLLALILFMLKLYGPLGIGGVERIVAYPQSIWMIIFGMYTLHSRRANLNMTDTIKV